MLPKKLSFQRMSLNARVWLVMIVIIIGLLAMTVLTALHARQSQMTSLETGLRNQIESAVALADSYHQRAEDGEFSQAEAEKRALKDIKTMRWNRGVGYIFAFDTHYVMRMHPTKPEKVGKNIRKPSGDHHYQRMQEADLKDGHGLTRYKQKMPNHSGFREKITYSQIYKPWNLNFAAGAYFTNINAAFAASLKTSLTYAFVLGLLVIVLVWQSMRSIRRSIGGEPSKAVEIATHIAEGDLGDRVGTTRIPQGSLLDALQRMRIKLTEIVDEVQQGSRTVSSAAQEMARGNDDLSQRTQEQASSLEETAASMEQMTSSVKFNAENASHANQLARGAREQAELGGDVVSRAVSAMSDINASSSKIAEIVGLIDEIAFQTNLLSLNAAVEAARAGEHGRGFAVVATEVRNLAQRSATAAKEIKTLITENVERINTGSALVDESGKALSDIVDSVKKVTDVVGEIAAASHEQSSGIGQVNNAVTQMDDMTQRNAALVEEAAAAARMMQEQSETLLANMAFFKLDDAVASPDEAVRLVPQSPRAKMIASVAKTPAPRAAAVAEASAVWEEF